MQNKTTPIAQAQEAEHPNDMKPYILYKPNEPFVENAQTTKADPKEPSTQSTQAPPKELNHPIPAIDSWLQRLLETNEIVPMPDELGITYMLKGNIGLISSCDLRAIADYLDELEQATAYNQSEEMKGIPEF